MCIRDSLADTLVKIIEKYDLDPSRLHLEITESAYTENPKQIIDTVTTLRELGFVIEMDDFGSGYSSLNMLNDMPIDILKLDMKFIRSEMAKPKSQGILQFIINLASWMNLSVVDVYKRQVYGHVSIDSIAGPSEILVIADDSANPRFVAADLLSQAEHDELASAILVTTSMELAKKVSDEVDGFLNILSRSHIIARPLDHYGYILVTDTMEKAVETANNIAPEHLEIVTANPFEVMTKIQNAGAIFIGEYSSEPLGDYFAGPNHILPTNGTAKFFSPLGVDDFIKKSSIIYYSREADVYKRQQLALCNRGHGNHFCGLAPGTVKQAGPLAHCHMDLYNHCRHGGSRHTGIYGPAPETFKGYASPGGRDVYKRQAQGKEGIHPVRYPL